MRKTNLILAVTVGTLLFACSQDDTDSNAALPSTGGTSANTSGGKSSATGGASTTTGGTSAVTNGGSSGGAGGSLTGGTSATAGTLAMTTGGATTIATAAGSSSVTGGSSTSGGVYAGGSNPGATGGAGGSSATGGSRATGGSYATGTTAGTSSIAGGGSTAKGGSSAGGSSSGATGGSGGIQTTITGGATAAGGTNSISNGGTYTTGGTSGGVGGFGETGGLGGASATTLGLSVAPGSSGTATVNVTLSGSTDSITKISVSVNPDNVTAAANAASVEVSGLLANSPHSFTVTVTTGSGGSVSSTSHPLAFYDILETFSEPECMQDTVFTGSFTFDMTDKTVSNLSGTLTECMYDGPPTVQLENQLSAVSTLLDGTRGWLAATFAVTTTATFADGSWAPGGIKTYGNDNAYALVFVPAGDPAQSLTSAQIDWLAYADCTPDGLMGTACMTGTTVAAYGRVGSMNGYPTAQITTER